MRFKDSLKVLLHYLFGFDEIIDGYVYYLLRYRLDYFVYLIHRNRKELVKICLTIYEVFKVIFTVIVICWNDGTDSSHHCWRSDSNPIKHTM